MWGIQLVVIVDIDRAVVEVSAFVEVDVDACGVVVVDDDSFEADDRVDVAALRPANPGTLPSHRLSAYRHLLHAHGCADVAVRN